MISQTHQRIFRLWETSALVLTGPQRFNPGQNRRFRSSNIYDERGHLGCLRIAILDLDLRGKLFYMSRGSDLFHLYHLACSFHDQGELLARYVV